MRGIAATGAYVPFYRLQRSAIGAVLGDPPGRGTRSVASYDEDATSMAVEAGRNALAHLPRPAESVEVLTLATTRPPYLEKTNATAVHAALNLDEGALAFDAIGSVRSALGAWRTALASDLTTLVTSSDLVYGLPSGADESEGGDAASALVFSAGDDVIAEYLGGASATAEFTHRWREPDAVAAKVWEERFGEHAFAPLVERAVTDGLKNAHLTLETVDHLIVTGTHTRSVRRAAKALGASARNVVDDLTSVVGFTGAAHPGLLLSSALDVAQPGETILLVALSDGVDVFAFRCTDAIATRRPSATVAAQIAATNDALPYATYLTWRGLLDRQPPRRPEPVAPAAPPSARGAAWKFGLIGSVCNACETRHLPPARVCISCAAVDNMRPQPMADIACTVTTFTLDRLAYSLHPPTVSAVLDFEGGGRIDCVLTDVDAASVEVGIPVEMTFRRLYTADGVHNYFWKARPVRTAL